MAITKADFIRKALKGQTNVTNVNLSPKKKPSANGNMGYFSTAKMQVVIDGQVYDAQFSGNVTILGSNKWADGEGLSQLVAAATDTSSA